MRRLAPLGLAAAMAVSCADSRTTMVPVPPPSSWTAELRHERAARDASFRTDPDSPLPRAARAAFRGLDYFDADPGWRYAGAVTPYAAPERFNIVTTAGETRPAERWGYVTFEHGGRVLTLQVYRLLDQADRTGGAGLFLPFKDATTGKTTYAAGRYVDLEGTEGGPFTLDFNRAYNPSCAYGEPERFQCPVTPAENALPIAVAAGERGTAAAPDGAP